MKESERVSDCVWSPASNDNNQATYESHLSQLTMTIKRTRQFRLLPDTGRGTTKLCM